MNILISSTSQTWWHVKTFSMHFKTHLSFKIFMGDIHIIHLVKFELQIIAPIFKNYKFMIK
jgi:hypothetical protein